MTPEATVSAVRPSGMEPMEIVDIPPYHYGAVFRR